MKKLWLLNFVLTPICSLWFQYSIRFSLCGKYQVIFVLFFTLAAVTYIRHVMCVTLVDCSIIPCSLILSKCPCKPNLDILSLLWKLQTTYGKPSWKSSRKPLCLKCDVHDKIWRQFSSWENVIPNNQSFLPL